jgi:hypothetical protein
VGEKAANADRDKEDDFLSLGQAMQDVKQKCTSCQDTVVKLTDVLSGERMGECSSRMSREMEQIEKQGERVSSLVASEQEFKRIVKRLGMLPPASRAPDSGRRAAISVPWPWKWKGWRKRLLPMPSK